MRISLNGKDFNTGVADSNGVLWYVTEWEGWDAPDMDQVVVSPTSKDGNIIASGRYTSRAVNLTGIVKAPNETALWLAWYELQSLVVQVRSTFDLVVYEPTPKRLGVSRGGKPKQALHGVGAFDFELPLLAADPMKYGLTKQSTTIAAGGSTALVNAGTYLTPPLLTTGASGTINVQNAATGQSFYTQTTVNSGTKADFTKRTLYSGSTNVYSAIHPNSEWWYLLPGSNTINNKGSASVTFEYYPTWI